MCYSFLHSFINSSNQYLVYAYDIPGPMLSDSETGAAWLLLPRAMNGFMGWVYMHPLGQP